MFRFRIISSVCFFLLFFLGLYIPSLSWIITFFVFLAALVGALEYYDLVKARGFHPQMLLGLIIGVFILIAAMLERMDMLPILLLLGIMLSSALHILQFAEKNIAAELGVSLFGFIYPALPLALILAILQHKEFQGAAPAIVFLVVVTWFCDIGAYLVGKKFGRNKLSPHLSPKKTVEGSIGGTIFSIVIALVLVAFWPGVKDIIPLSWAVILALLFSVIGQVGDLVESALKRDAGVKDSGIDLTGHGGILDVIDSLIYCVPIMFLYLMLQYPDLNWL